MTLPDAQELIALGIVALVAGRLLWRRWGRGQPATKQAGKGGACGDCSAAGPPPKEATVRFYRRRSGDDA
jgi:hypothetical protein